MTNIFSRELSLLWEEALKKGVSEQTLEKMLDERTDEVADGVTDRLRADGPRMLAEHAEERQGFEERLHERWRPALDRYEMVLVACTEVGADLNDSLRSDPAPSGNPFKRRALTLNQARACMVASEIYALLRTGHAAGAQARWRTLHEIAVIAFLLGDHDEGLAQRFLLHRQVDQWREAKCYQENCKTLGEPPFSEEEMNEFRASYEAVVGQYEKGYKEMWGWSKPLFQSPGHKPTFDQLEGLAGLGHHKPFVKVSHRVLTMLVRGERWTSLSSTGITK